MDKKKINEIFTRFELKNSNPKIELDYYNPFTLLIAVILSAQSTDKGVNRATPKLFEIADNPYKMLELGENGLKEYIKSIGLYNSKARNIIKLCEVLATKYNGEVPSHFDELNALPGVGRKSANVVLNSLWNHKVIAVDTHVFRVSNRIGLCKTKNPLQTELALMKIVPNKWLDRAHHWLVLHGRYVCKARKPECNKCIINDLCDYYQKLEIAS